MPPLGELQDGEKEVRERTARAAAAPTALPDEDVPAPVIVEDDDGDKPDEPKPHDG